MKNLVSSLEEIPLFGLERGARQGEAIHNFFTYFSIGHLFMLLNSNIKRFEFFCHLYLHSAYAEDTTFFVKVVQSVENIIYDFFV